MIQIAYFELSRPSRLPTRSVATLILSCLAVLFAAGSVRADTLLLKQGDTLSGVLVDIESGRLRFITAQGEEKLIDRSDVVSIHFGDEQPAPAPQADAPAKPAPPTSVPAETVLLVRLIDKIKSDVNGVGEVFRGTMEAPVSVDETELIPRGTPVLIEVTHLSQANALAGKEEIAVALQSVELDGREVPVSTDEARVYKRAKGGLFGGIGAIATGVAGELGGGKAAAYAAVTAATITTFEILKGTKISINSESILLFKLTEDLDLGQ